MAERGFTVYFDQSASQSGKSDGGALAPSTTSSTTLKNGESSTSSFSPTAGRTEGPFVSKSQNSELANLRISEDGIKTIIRQEGYADQAYPDAAGYSVGYGHYLGSGEEVKNTKITPEQGLKYLAADIAKVEKQVQARITAPLDDKQFTALVSFAYNAGAGSLDKGISTKINEGNLDAASDQMKLYVKSRDSKSKELVRNEQLVKRREFETGLLLGKK